MLGAGGSIDLARLLLDLLIVLVAAKSAAELAERFRVPAVVGEICAGILIGPSVLGLVELGGDRGVSITVMAEIGVLLLLLQVGMEMDLGELAKVGKASLLVAIIGVVLPFGFGAATGLAFGESGNTALFFGAALTATSVGITARVFGDLRALATTEARIVLGAAVADDVLGLVILTVVVKIVTGSSVGPGLVIQTVGLALVFLLGTGIVGLFVVPRLLDVVHRRASSPAAVTVVALAIALGFAELAAQAKLAFIIGAFMAGLGLGKSRHHERIALDLGAIGNIFIPVFFVQIGINADLAAMVKPSVLGIAAAMTALAVIGKMAAAVGAMGTRADKLLIGLGMVPRGEVGLIFASIGLAAGVLNDDQYGALLIVVLVTTIVTPPLLRLRIGRIDATNARSAADTQGADVEPPGGWLVVTAGHISLRATPAADETLPIALRVAALAATARPCDELLDWFAQHRNHPLQWSIANTPALVRLLRSSDPRGWRFLDITGVLTRALPEVADVMRRRRADISDLDPIGALRFAVVDRLDTLAVEFDLADDRLVLAAFVADVCADASNDRDCAYQLAARLAPETEAARITNIVADAHTLRAATGHRNQFDEADIIQMAAHLASPAHAHDAHRLAVALGALPTWQREALDERLALIGEALDHPELTSGEATNLAAAHRLAAQRLLDDPAARDRLKLAPTSYLLSHQPDELARHARLVEPLPHRGTVRVTVSPEPEPDHWTIDIACRDSDGLLAHLTDVLANNHLDVVAATIATWPDGAVLDTFTVRTTDRPAARTLAQQIEDQLSRPLHLSAGLDLTVSFDHGAHPWHSMCIVSGPDQPGSLRAVSAAFAAAGVLVHAARIASADYQLNDRFWVTDRLGHKLDEPTTERVRRALAGQRLKRRFALR